jgi:hypothetical protein
MEDPAIGPEDRTMAQFDHIVLRQVICKNSHVDWTRARALLALSPSD